MRSFRFYDAETGLLSTRTLMVGGSVNLGANTPAGYVAIEGKFDPLSQRVDIETGEVVDYQPPQPSREHEWNPDRKRWLLTAEAAQAQVDDEVARRQILMTEASSLRAIRELLLNPDNQEAKDALQAIDDDIAAQRPKLRATERLER